MIIDQNHPDFYNIDVRTLSGKPITRVERVDLEKGELHILSRYFGLGSTVSKEPFILYDVLKREFWRPAEEAVEVEPQAQEPLVELEENVRENNRWLGYNWNTFTWAVPRYHVIAMPEE